MEITLYRGAEEIIAAIDVDPETGEIGTGVPLEVLVSKNPIGCAGYVLHCQATAKMIKGRIDELAKMAKAAENRAERVKQMLQANMKLTGVNKIEATDKTYSVKLYKDRDEEIEIFDEKQIPALYLREIPARTEPAKDLIKKAIKDGFDVPGAVLRKKDRLAIK